MYSFLYYLLGSMMLAIGMVALILLVHSIYTRSTSSSRKIFTSVIVLAMFGRGVYFLLSPSIIDGNLQSFPLNAFFFWNHMIDFAFFLAYFMLFVSWANFYYRTSVGSDSELLDNKATVILFISFVLGSIITIAVFFFTADTDEECKRVDLATTCYIASLNVITAGLFGVYGLKIYRLIDEFKFVFKRVHSWKIKAITWICSLCFLCRSCMMVFSVLELSDNPDTKSFSVDWYWVFIYYLTLEMLPTCAMLFFLRKGPSSQPRIDEYEPIHSP
ncbi:hypothetical protein SAMD00019534_101200, partial [Acytostelium subglobosum LB1]|uniref:hypothetical protein n=1 Tax=Acytostelium subglobosum LB1 TaxID=1410327 RepID=UPI000644C65E